MKSITVWSHLLKKSLMENFILCAGHMDGSREYEKRRKKDRKESDEREVMHRELYIR